MNLNRTEYHVMVNRGRNLENLRHEIIREVNYQSTSKNYNQE